MSVKGLLRGYIGVRMKEKGRKIFEFLAKNGKLIFPVIVCLAVAVTVVIALKAGRVRMDKLEQIGDPSSVSESSTEPSESSKPEENALIKNEDPEINAIVEKYYTALAQGDEEAILATCDKVEERHMLQWLETARYIEYYPVLEVYSKKGYAEGDTVAYIYFKIKFTGKDAEYPGFQRLYISTREDGTLYIRRTSLPAEAEEYVLKISEEADVEEFSNRVNVEFLDLMAQQPDLLTYMNDVSEEVARVVGEKLADKNQQDGQEGQNVTGQGNGDGNGEGSDGQGNSGEGTGNDGHGGDGQDGNQGQTEEVVYATATTTVNVRKSDSEKAEKIGRISGGTKIRVLEQMVNGWSKVEYEKSEGYIMSKYLKVQESVTKYTAIGKVKATDNINVRAEASTDSAKMGTLVKGEIVDLFAEEGEWCKIAFKDQVAYVKAEYVEKQ